jgi:hypothetical protein
MKRPKTKFAILGLIMLFSFPVSSSWSDSWFDRNYNNKFIPQLDFSCWGSVSCFWN